jgi:hypothetical protein
MGEQGSFGDLCKILNYLLASSVRLSSSVELSRIIDGCTLNLTFGFALHRDIPAQRNRPVACVCI